MIQVWVPFLLTIWLRMPNDKHELISMIGTYRPQTFELESLLFICAQKITFEICLPHYIRDIGWHFVRRQQWFPYTL